MLYVDRYLVFEVFIVFTYLHLSCLPFYLDDVPQIDAKWSRVCWSLMATNSDKGSTLGFKIS